MDPVSQVGRDPRGGWCWGPAAPGSRPSLTLALSLSPLVRPKLASAGSFRALKEPLAFLRSLELVSSGVCGAGAQAARLRVRRGPRGSPCSVLLKARLPSNPLPRYPQPPLKLPTPRCHSEGRTGEGPLGGGSVHGFPRELGRGCEGAGLGEDAPPGTGTEGADGGAAAGLAAPLGSAGVRPASRAVGLSGAAGRAWPRGGGWSARGQVLAGDRWVLDARSHQLQGQRTHRAASLLPLVSPLVTSRALPIFPGALSASLGQLSLWEVFSDLSPFYKTPLPPPHTVQWQLACRQRSEAEKPRGYRAVSVLSAWVTVIQSEICGSPLLGGLEGKGTHLNRKFRARHVALITGPTSDELGSYVRGVVLPDLSSRAWDQALAARLWCLFA